MSNSVPLAFGLYIGNSTCSISVHKNGNVDVVANSSGERVTPAVIGFHEKEVVTGTAAKQGLVQHDRCSVVGTLRAVGSSAQDKLTFPLNMKCQISYDNNKPKFCIQNGDKNKMVTPEVVLQHVFTLLKDIACSHSQEEKLPVVVTLPAWITDSTISSVHSSATNAGFQVIKTISQPASVCLAYELLDDNKAKLNVLMFHCGGTSIVATVGGVAGGLLNIKETSYSFASAGDTLTSVLVNHFAKEFFAKYKGDPLENRRSRRKLYSASENCKHVLSTMTIAQVHVESLWEGVDFSTQLSRARFDGLISSTLNEFLSLLKEVLLRANLSYNEIDKVILSGGTCKIPKLQNLIANTLPNAEVLKKFSPDETSAIGAAKEALHCLQRNRLSVQTPMCLLSCLSSSIYAKVAGGKESQCIFTSGIPTHCRQSLSFECPPGPCRLVIYEATEPTDYPNDDQVLAEIELDFTCATTSVTLHMACSLKSDGGLVIKVSETLYKTSESFIIEAECR